MFDDSWSRRHVGLSALEWVTGKYKNSETELLGCKISGIYSKLIKPKENEFEYVA